MAHARRKFFELHAANVSPIAFEALNRIAALYEIERRGKHVNTEDRQSLRMSEAMSRLVRSLGAAQRASGATTGALGCDASAGSFLVLGIGRATVSRLQARLRRSCVEPEAGERAN